MERKLSVTLSVISDGNYDVRVYPAYFFYFFYIALNDRLPAPRAGRTRNAFENDPTPRSLIKLESIGDTRMKQLVIVPAWAVPSYSAV